MPRRRIEPDAEPEKAPRPLRSKKVPKPPLEPISRYHAMRKLDPETCRRLAEIQCTEAEAAAFMRVSVETFERALRRPEFAEAWAAGREEGKVSLRRLQWMHARRPDGGGVQMTIHLAKHILGERDKLLFDFEELVRKIDSLTDTQLAELNALQKKALAAIEERDAARLDLIRGDGAAATRH